MTQNDFFQSVANGKIDRVYLFTGPEEWMKREALDALRNKLLPPGLEQLNDTVLDDATAQQIIDAAETVPMMSDCRIVTVRDWPPLMSGKSKNEESETERIQQWLDHTPETCCLVFYMRSEMDGRKKASSMIRKKSTGIQFDFLNDSELASWCTRQLKPFKKTMKLPAVQTLAFIAGRELTRLSEELNKLAAYVEDRTEITADDVKAIVPASLEYNVFELINRLLEGNISEAQNTINSMIRNGQNAVGILAMLTRQLRQLTHMRLALDAGESVQSVQEMLQMHPYAAKQVARQCRGLNAQTLKSLYETCVAFDFDIKSGRVRDSAALDAIVMKISSSNLKKL